jgi:hypothetical protein
VQYFQHHLPTSDLQEFLAYLPQSPKKNILDIDSDANLPYLSPNYKFNNDLQMFLYQPLKNPQPMPFTDRPVPSKAINSFFIGDRAGRIKEWCFDNDFIVKDYGNVHNNAEIVILRRTGDGKYLYSVDVRGTLKKVSVGKGKVVKTWYRQSM